MRSDYATWQAREAKDRLAWQAVARRVMAGEFSQPDESTREALVIGLRGIDEACRKALQTLAKKGGKNK